MEINNLSLNDLLFKFKISDEIKSKLTKEDFITLTEIGLPSKILSNNFVYYEQIIQDDDNNLILGYSTHVNEWKLKISLNDFSIFYTGKGKLTSEVFAFYNKSISKLLLCLFSYDFFLRRLIKSNLLGEYHINHEKYADLLFEIISDIDKVAADEGVWFYLIEEMRLGVI
jgi:hypothetical protein